MSRVWQVSNKRKAFNTGFGLIQKVTNRGTTYLYKFQGQFWSPKKLKWEVHPFHINSYVCLIKINHTCGYAQRTFIHLFYFCKPSWFPFKYTPVKTNHKSKNNGWSIPKMNSKNWHKKKKILSIHLWKWKRILLLQQVSLLEMLGFATQEYKAGL